MSARVGLCWVLLSTAVAAEGGRELAEKACATCHAFPEPALLDRESWRSGVLPRMAGLLGLKDGVRDTAAPEGAYPAVPLVSEEAWGTIVDYYLAAAPAELPDPGDGRVELEEGAGWFEVERLEKDGSPATTAVAVDEERQLLLVGDVGGRRLVVYGERLERQGEIALGGVPVEIRLEGAGRYLVTLIGQEVGPNHRAEGKVVRVTGEGAVTVLADGLERPVSAVARGAGGVGGEELVVSCFGFMKGGLLSIGEGGVVRLIDQAGAMSFSDGSGLVLMAQGDERVARIEEDGVEPVLRFPPSYGVSSMSEADLDGDGDLDLVITAGDNGDDAPVFKPYHGIYLYENDGDDSFREVAFVPLHGAYGVAVADFDGDGDQDLVAVAYFADYAGGEEGVMVLENEGEWAFTARAIAGTGLAGRFAVVAAGDLDGDDDIDVVLGNFPGGPSGPAKVDREQMGAWLANGAVTVLRNVTED